MPSYNVSIDSVPLMEKPASFRADPNCAVDGKLFSVHVVRIQGTC